MTLSVMSRVILTWALRRSTIKVSVIPGMMGGAMYKRILELTEEIEAVIPTDDHVRLEELRVRRAEAFAVIKTQGAQASPEAIALIEKIQECEKRCREQALRKLAALKKDMDVIRKGKRLEKAYGRFVGNV